MTAREQAAILPSETVEIQSDKILPGQRFWPRLATAIGRSVERALIRRQDHRDLRHLSSRALRDLGLEPDVFDRR